MSFKDQELLPPILKKVMKASNSEFLFMVILPSWLYAHSLDHSPCRAESCRVLPQRTAMSHLRGPPVNGITGRTRTKGYIIVEETFHLK